MFWCNKTLVEFDIIQHQISFAGSSDVTLSFALPNISCPGKTNLMLDCVSSNKCLMITITVTRDLKVAYRQAQEAQSLLIEINSTIDDCRPTCSHGKCLFDQRLLLHARHWLI